jgi:hypothetical protein
VEKFRGLGVERLRASRPKFIPALNPIYFPKKINMKNWV